MRFKLINHFKLQKGKTKLNYLYRMLNIAYQAPKVIKDRYLPSWNGSG